MGLMCCWHGIGPGFPTSFFSFMPSLLLLGLNKFMGQMSVFKLDDSYPVSCGHGSEKSRIIIFLVPGKKEFTEKLRRDL